MSSIAWVDGAPSHDDVPALPRFFSAQQLRAGLRVIGGVQRVFTHFVGQTVPCLGEKCFCRGQQANQYPRKLKCYLGALLQKGPKDDGGWHWDRVIWEVNETNFPELGDPPYRGVFFETWKVKAAQTRIYVKRSAKPAADIPFDKEPALDVRLLLQKKWRISEEGDAPQIRGGAA